MCALHSHTLEALEAQGSRVCQGQAAASGTKAGRGQPKSSSPPAPRQTADLAGVGEQAQHQAPYNGLDFSITFAAHTSLLPSPQMASLCLFKTTPPQTVVTAAQHTNTLNNG